MLDIVGKQTKASVLPVLPFFSEIFKTNKTENESFKNFQSKTQVIKPTERRISSIDFLEFNRSPLPVDREFECFLQNAVALRALVALELTETTPEQAVHGPPAQAQQPTWLKVNESLVTNFNFVLQFEQLEVFQTDRPPIGFVSNRFPAIGKVEVFSSEQAMRK